MFIINRCFKNIWLESQMIHVALFSFQRTTFCLSKLAFVWNALLQATHLLYRISFKLSRTFLFFFFVWVICSSKALPIKERYSRLSRCLAATCIILQDAQAFVNRYLELFQKKLHETSDTKKASLSRCSSPYGRGSWTRTNACGIQRPVPYQLGDTPVSFDIYILYGWIRHLSTHIFYFFSGISIAFS